MRGDMKQARGRAPGAAAGDGVALADAARVARRGAAPRVGPCSTSGPGPAASPSTSPRGPGACSGSTPTPARSSRPSAAPAWPGSPTSLFVVADAEQADYRAFGQPGRRGRAPLHVRRDRRPGRRRPAAGRRPRFRGVPHRPVAGDGPRVALRLRARPGSRRAGRRRASASSASRWSRRSRASRPRPRPWRAAAELRARWEADGRWAAWERFVAEGGRTLTQSRLVVLARRDGA